MLTFYGLCLLGICSAYLPTAFPSQTCLLLTLDFPQ